MTLQLPSDLAGRMQAYVGDGSYPSTEAVLRHALDALDFYRKDIAAIREGIDDETAGRTRLARDVLQDARLRHQQAAKS
jgi:Arc/MetJ-type ribon-helix-helix transcriptional regulator